VWNLLSKYENRLNNDVFDKIFNGILTSIEGGNINWDKVEKYKDKLSDSLIKKLKYKKGSMKVSFFDITSIMIGGNGSESSVIVFNNKREEKIKQKNGKNKKIKSTFKEIKDDGRKEVGIIIEEEMADIYIL